MKALPRRAALISGAAIAVVAVLCGVLGYLQYRWIGQVSAAERDRLHGELRFALSGLSRAVTPHIHEADFKQVASELTAQYLATPALADYEIQIVSAPPESALVYSSNPAEHEIWSRPDAYEPIFDHSNPGHPPMDRGGPSPDDLRRGPPGEGRRGRRPDGPGVWQLLARHKTGSLEDLVAGAQRRNLAVSGAILVMIFGIAAALVLLMRRAEALAEAQIGFVAGVSHELRTPLTVIRTAAFNLASGKTQKSPEAVRQYGRMIEGESEKLEGLIDQVLRFASGRAGQAVRELRPVALGPLVEEAAAGCGAEAEVSVEEGLPTIPGDAQALRHAFRNLLDNAVRYGGGNRIGISAKQANLNRFPHVRIEVWDRGPGIPPDEIHRVFEPFFRGSRAVREQIHGTGLGLNIVKTIAEAHGGEVTVMSESGSGTHFVVHLPCPGNLTDGNRKNDENSAD